MSEILTVILSLIPIAVILLLFMWLMKGAMDLGEGNEREDGERHRRTSLLTGKTRWDEDDDDDFDFEFEDDDDEF